MIYAESYYLICVTVSHMEIEVDMFGIPETMNPGASFRGAPGNRAILGKLITR